MVSCENTTMATVFKMVENKMYVYVAVAGGYYNTMALVYACFSIRC